MKTHPLPRILCVDDEPNVLDGLTRTLRRRYDVTTAVGGAAALGTLEREEPFSVVVSDLRMPGMDGVAFLSRTRELSPDATRVLLTGQADLVSAAAAVNEGAIFRFLIKPCAAEALLQALAAAVEQHRLITAERVLLEQTLHGSIKALTDILAMVNPAAFGRAARLKKLASELLSHLGEEPNWQVDVAAMLSQVGSVTLPGHTVEKLYRGDTLTHAENLVAERLPRIASEIIAGIPRLESVRDILLHHGRRFDGTGSQPGAPRGVEIPLGARVLKLVADFDVLATRGLSVPLALDTLQSRRGWYDPELLKSLSELYGENEESHSVVETEIRTVRPGMVFAEDVRTNTGVLLVARGQEVTERLVERLRSFGDPTQARQLVRMIMPARDRGEAEGGTGASRSNLRQVC